MGFKQIGIFVPWLKLQMIIAWVLNIQIVLIMEIIYVLGGMSVFLQYFAGGVVPPAPRKKSLPNNVIRQLFAIICDYSQ